MRNRNRRLSVIVDLIRNNHIGSQDHLRELLQKNGYEVTQATLSRDLKSLRINKTSDDSGKPMYIVPEGADLKDNYLNSTDKINPPVSNGFLTLAISGNIAVIKTRNGYAPGMAYDIDMSRQPEILGTIPGSDTIFVVLKNGLSNKAVMDVFGRLFPLAAINSLEL